MIEAGLAPTRCEPARVARRGEIVADAPQIRRRPAAVRWLDLHDERARDAGLPLRVASTASVMLRSSRSCIRSSWPRDGAVPAAAPRPGRYSPYRGAASYRGSRIGEKRTALALDAHFGGGVSFLGRLPCLTQVNDHDDVMPYR